MDTKNLLAGFDFSAKVEGVVRRRTPQSFDGALIYSVRGKKRKFNRCEINFLSFFRRIEKKFKTVAIGTKGTDVLFVFDNEQMKDESLTIAPSTDALNSREKALLIFKAIGFELNTKPDAHNVVYFTLTKTFDNIYMAKFDLPKKEDWPPHPEAKNIPSSKNF